MVWELFCFSLCLLLSFFAFLFLNQVQTILGVIFLKFLVIAQNLFPKWNWESLVWSPLGPQLKSLDYSKLLENSLRVTRNFQIPKPNPCFAKTGGSQTITQRKRMPPDFWFSHIWHSVVYLCRNMHWALTQFGPNVLIDLSFLFQVTPLLSIWIHIDPKKEGNSTSVIDTSRFL